MESLDALPNVPLRHVDGITEAFLARGAVDFHAAARYVYHLPYGRNTDRANFRLVLSEGCGTCSTKHALLAQLAQEQGLAIALTLGIYDMTERNTPGVGRILEHYHLTALPEAHCYLTCNGQRIDITRSGVEPTEPISYFLHEETITPEQIGAYKVAWHQQFLQAWLPRSTVAEVYTLADLWRIREACIAALGQ
jgi:hypothetical protein